MIQQITVSQSNNFAQFIVYQRSGLTGKLSAPLIAGHFVAVSKVGETKRRQNTC
jgi:hypothetical protein